VIWLCTRDKDGEICTPPYMQAEIVSTHEHDASLRTSGGAANKHDGLTRLRFCSMLLCGKGTRGCGRLTSLDGPCLLKRLWVVESLCRLVCECVVRQLW
jgi:hypothetical protein